MAPSTEPQTQTDPLAAFHPAVTNWFRGAFSAPSPVQVAAWPAIKAGSHTLIAAPTGSGKTLAAFLSAIDDLVREAEAGPLPDETRVVYVSPLKALSNDIERNLQAPLRGVREQLAAAGGAAHANGGNGAGDHHAEGGPSVPEVRAGLRTGDTPPSARAAMVKRPPHIVVTTPESLYLLLTSASGRRMLATTRTVIVDEVHAVLGSKRGSHLALSLERLDALTERPVTRIGLSATQKPLSTSAAFLTGMRDGKPLPCQVIDIGHRREMELAIEIPGSPLEAVMPNEVWDELYQRLAELILEHRTTLIFVNTRRLSERMTHNLSALIGAEHVAAHHGSLSKEHRLDAEQRLKSGGLRAIVATASLELGIDIGVVDLVCQFGSPKSLMAFLQRVGRSGHHISGTPKGRLFPLTRDELVEGVALVRAVQQGELDRIVMPEQPLEILAQQIVAEVGAREWQQDELFATFTRAAPYAALQRERFDTVVRMLAEGFSTQRGRRAAYLHQDAIGGRLRGRRGASLAALTNGGAIPDNFDFQVRVDPQDLFIGTINEDFAIESMPGDIFQLGNKSWEILKVETGVVRVADAGDKPPTLPFWLGEAPGRTDELSRAVSALRIRAAELIRGAEGAPGAVRWVMDEVGLDAEAADQLITYLHAGLNALDAMPTHDTAVMERFFDEAGDMHLVIHSPRGSRVNRAWGLALRKRFCRSFNFELQAAANEDAIVLSLGQTHSFPLADVWRYLNRKTVRHVLVQALLDAPMFQVRWRWNASRALAVLRFRGGKRVAPYLQRMQSEDLISLVFPDQLACLENITGEREIPDHPLVQQSIEDCLHEAMDIDALEQLVGELEAGKIRLVTRDLREPSPFAQEIINARPYAFLDDAPLEERRTQAIRNRRWLTPDEAREFGTLDAAAIARVREEAMPRVEDADELHDALDLLTFIDQREGEQARGEQAEPEPIEGEQREGKRQEDERAGWTAMFETLVAQGRAARLTLPGADTPRWIAAERLPLWEAAFPDAAVQPTLHLPASLRERVWTRDTAIREIVRGRMEAAGPISVATLARQTAVPPGDVELALVALETEGAVFRGEFTGAGGEEWCERRLLARIHRYTLARLRREIEPLAFDDYLRFLFEWQQIGPVDADPATGGAEGPEGLLEVLRQLEGYEAPAAAWEQSVLPARLPNYEPAWLDTLCATGEVAWARLRPATERRANGSAARTGPVASSPLTLVARERMELWRAAQRMSAAAAALTSGNATAGGRGGATGGTSAPVTAPDAAGGGTSLEGTANADGVALSAASEQVRACLSVRGALFRDEVQRHTGLLPAEIDRALGELAAAGQVTCDSFAGLRALIRPSARQSASRRAARARWRGNGAGPAGRRGGVATAIPATAPSNAASSGAPPRPGSRPAPRSLVRSGRWSLLPQPLPDAGDEAQADAELEQIAMALLGRYGVVFRRMLDRETLAPPWRVLVRVYRRLEARGHIRGGYFVSGVGGEQFALAEAIAAMRSARRRPAAGQLRVLTAVDPVGVVGLKVRPVLEQQRIAGVRGNRILFRDGVPIAVLDAGTVRFLEREAEAALSAAERWELERLLIARDPSGARQVAQRLREVAGTAPAG